MARSKGRSRRKRAQRRRASRKMRASPPAQSILSNARRLKLPYTKTPASADKGKFSVSLTVGELFTYKPNVGIGAVYREVKVHNVEVYFQSNVATSTKGSVCLVVSDDQENDGESDGQFADVCTYPGAMVRRVWQNIASRWFPTEPSDREWHSPCTSTNTTPICRITLRHSDPTGIFDGQLICYANVSVRGRAKNTAVVSAVQQLMDNQLSGMCLE